MPLWFKSKVAQAIAYGILSAGTLILFLYLTFPMEIIGDRINRELQKHSNNSLRITYTEVSTWRFTGVALRQVNLLLGANSPSAKPIPFAALKARLQLFPLFLGRLSVGYLVEFPLDSSRRKGVLDGRFAVKGERTLIQATLKNISLATPPLIEQISQLPVQGLLSGRIDTDLHPITAKTRGAVTLRLENAQLGPGSLQGFTVPQMSLGTIELVAVIDAGNLKIQQFTQTGGDFNLSISGGGLLQPRLLSSSMDLCIKFRGQPTFLQRNPNIATALQLAEVRLKKDRDEFLHIPLNGTLSHPVATPGLCSKAF